MQQRTSSYLDALATIAIIITCSAITWSIVKPKQDESIVSGSGNQGIGELITEAEPIDVLNRTSVAGASGAKVALVEFSDYQCPFCARHASDTAKAIRKTFVDSGLVQYVFVNLPLQQIHPLAVSAAYAAECAGAEGKFWQMHERLFANQKMLSQGAIADYAAALELRQVEFNQCMSGRAVASKVESDVAVAARLGITSTPSFVVGHIKDGKIIPVRKIQGAASYDAFKQNIEHVLSSEIPQAGN